MPKKKIWIVGGAFALVITIGLVSTALEKAASAQARSNVPQFEPDPLFFKNLPNRWVTGQISGIDVDRNDHVWVIHRPATIPDGEKSASLNPPQSLCCIPAPPVLEFDQNGGFVKAWGGPGAGYEWPTSEHGMHADHKNNIWLGGNGKGDQHILKFTNTGKFLLQIGKKNQSKGSNDTANVNGAAGIFVYPKTNEVFVADGYTNRRVIVFDADSGAYKRHWGAYGKKPEDTKNPPREQIVQGPPQTSFGTPVHGVVVANDDTVYVADRSNNRIQVFRLDGTFIKEAFVNRKTLQNEGTTHGFALSRDPAQRYLYVADGSNKAVHIVDRQTLALLDSIGGHAGHNAREFFHIHSIGGPDSKGNLYFGEVNDGQRYYRYLLTGMGRPVNPGYATISNQ